MGSSTPSLTATGAATRAGAAVESSAGAVAVASISSYSGTLLTSVESLVLHVAEDPEHGLREPVVEAGHDREHDRDEDDHHGGVRQQFLTRRPDDLTQFRHDLTDEVADPAEKSHPFDVTGTGRLRALGRPRLGRSRLGGYRTAVILVVEVVLVVRLVRGGLVIEFLIERVVRALVDGVVTTPLPLGHFALFRRLRWIAAA